MLIENGLIDGQAQSGAGLRTAVGLVALEVTVPDVRQYFFIDSRTVIGDLHPDLVAVCQECLDNDQLVIPIVL